jgi:hypothetical protein
MGFGSDALDAKLNLQVHDEHRIVVIGTPEGLDVMSDNEISRCCGGRRAYRVWRLG